VRIRRIGKNPLRQSSARRIRRIRRIRGIRGIRKVKRRVF